jgi:hypothetical protein
VSPPPPDAVGGALLTFPDTPQQPGSEGQNVTPHRAGFATPPDQARIGGSSPPDLGTDRHRQDGKAAPQTGAAKNQTTAKEKTLRAPTATRVPA